MRVRRGGLRQVVTVAGTGPVNKQTNKLLYNWYADRLVRGVDLTVKSEEVEFRFTYFTNGRTGCAGDIGTASCAIPAAASGLPSPAPGLSSLARGNDIVSSGDRGVALRSPPGRPRPAAPRGKCVSTAVHDRSRFNDKLQRIYTFLRFSHHLIELHFITSLDRVRYTPPGSGAALGALCLSTTRERDANDAQRRVSSSQHNDRTPPRGLYGAFNSAPFAALLLAVVRACIHCTVYLRSPGALSQALLPKLCFFGCRMALLPATRCAIVDARERPGAPITERQRRWQVLLPPARRITCKGGVDL